MLGEINISLQIAICDDEQTQIDYMAALVEKWAAENNIFVNNHLYKSAEEFLFHFAEKKFFDVIILDIQMYEMNGIELAREIRKENEAVQILFVTGFADFVCEGYEVSALHYLMKPVNEIKLFQVLNKAHTYIIKAEPIIIFKVGSENVRLVISEIVFVESFAHSVVLELSNCTQITVNMSISEVESLLVNNFVRCHRSYLVGLKHIKRISKTEILLDTGKAIPISRRLHNAVNQSFIKYYVGEVGDKP